MPKTLNVLYEGIHYPMSSYLKIKEHEKLLGRKLTDIECIDIMMNTLVYYAKKNKDFMGEIKKLKTTQKN